MQLIRLISWLSLCTATNEVIRVSIPPGKYINMQDSISNLNRIPQLLQTRSSFLYLAVQKMEMSLERFCEQRPSQCESFHNDMYFFQAPIRRQVSHKQFLNRLTRASSSGLAIQRQMHAQVSKETFCNEGTLLRGIQYLTLVVKPILEVVGKEESWYPNWQSKFEQIASMRDLANGIMNEEEFHAIHSYWMSLSDVLPVYEELVEELPLIAFHEGDSEVSDISSA